MRLPLVAPHLIPFRGLAITGRASKNVAKRKNKLDSLKSKLNSRLTIKIIMAARNGNGQDAAHNLDLARALKEAHAHKLPKENIERALKKSKEKSAEDFKENVYEILGAGSAGIVVQTLSDNSNRAVKLVKEKAGKHDCKFTSGGSVLFGFDSKGVLRVMDPYDEDAVIEAALEGEVDDVDFAEAGAGKGSSGEEDGESSQPPLILTSPEGMTRLQDALSKAGIATHAEIEYVPRDRVAVSEEDWLRNSELIEALEGLDDVDSVYHNMTYQNNNII